MDTLKESDADPAHEVSRKSSKLYQRWTQQAFTELKRLWSEDVSTPKIAKAMGRSYRSISSKVYNSGLVRAEANKIRHQVFKVVGTTIGKSSSTPRRIQCAYQDRKAKTVRRHGRDTVTWSEGLDAVVKDRYRAAESDQTIATILTQEVGAQMTAHDVFLRRMILGLVEVFDPSPALAEEIIGLHKSGFKGHEIFKKSQGSAHYDAGLALGRNGKQTICAFLRSRGFGVHDYRARSWTISDETRLQRLWEEDRADWKHIANVLDRSLRACGERYQRVKSVGYTVVPSNRWPRAKATKL